MIALLQSGRALIWLGGGSLLVAAGLLGLAGTRQPEAVAVAPLVPALAPVAAPLALTRYLVASQDIARGTPVTAAALTLLGMERPPAEGALTTLEPALGQVALQHIFAGQAILPAQLGGATGAGLGPLVPAGLRAMTVKVAEDSGISGLLRPGDRVDLILATQPPAAPGAQAVALTSQPPELAQRVLSDRLVLAIGEALEPPAEPAPG
ncbi:Flp pilus assembly protein CpaB, partial [Roseomonas sp. 18066]|uniref:Flp pilus assembly protein CpaB n=1 Tax=Roseomonas sp. 18066 TaxID=2681412 RepID=UPI0013590290